MTMKPMRRGRPRLLDPEELRRLAIRIVARDGYQATTMGGIASELGMSVRTLHRHFPTKADIVWGSIDESFLVLDEALGGAGEDVPIIDALVGALDAAFGIPGQDAETQARMRLIATTPELQAHRSDAFLRWRRQIVQFITARTGLDEPVALAVGAAVQAAILAAFADWATGPSELPAASAVARALHGLAVLR